MKEYLRWEGLRAISEALAQGIDFSITKRLSTVLNTLRSFAAFLVVSGHVTSHLFSISGSNDWKTLIFNRYMQLGRHGVVIFFVLSGFLIGKAATQTFIARDRRPMEYVLDRVSRIYVVLIPALIC